MRYHLLQFFVFVSMKIIEIEQEKEEEQNRLGSEKSKTKPKKTITDNPKSAVQNVPKAGGPTKLGDKHAASEEAPSKRTLIALCLKDLLADKIIPNLSKLELFPKNWTTETLYNAEVDQVIQMNKVPLTAIFRTFMRVKRNALFEGIMEILFGEDESRGKMSDIFEVSQERSNTQDSIEDSGAEEEGEAESEQVGDDANKEPEGP